jgi:hypothetical protein
MNSAAKAIMAITGLVQVLVVFVPAYLARRSEQQHLLKNGARVQGVVVSVSRESPQAGTPLILRYRFTPEGQAMPVEGCCTVKHFGPYQSGDVATICYNRAHPVSSIILSPKGSPL